MKNTKVNTEINAIDRIERRKVTETHYMAVGTRCETPFASLGITLTEPGKCYEEIISLYQKLKPKAVWNRATIRKIVFRLYGGQIPTK